MHRFYPALLLLLFAFTADNKTPNILNHSHKQGIFFSFKGKTYELRSTMRIKRSGTYQRGEMRQSQMDSLASVFYEENGYIQIIRQDHPVFPKMGIALGFSFDESTESYPISPDNAVLQLKDFTWGGVEFSASDTLNYTGVNNEVSEDLSIQIDSFSNQVIYGKFSGLLLSGSDLMAQIDSGYFRIKVFRK